MVSNSEPILFCKGCFPEKVEVYFREGIFILVTLDEKDNVIEEEMTKEEIDNHFKSKKWECCGCFNKVCSDHLNMETDYNREV